MARYCFGLRFFAALAAVAVTHLVAAAQLPNIPKPNFPPIPVPNLPRIPVPGSLPNPFAEAAKRAEQAGKDAAKDAKSSLDDFGRSAKVAGGKLSDEGKKAGAMVSNAWKWLTNDLDPLDGWVRDHCQPGDILLGGNPVNKDLGQFAHVAIVTDVKNEKLFESNCKLGSDKPGTHEISWSEFSKHYLYMYRLRVKGLTPAQAGRVVEWVKQHNGKPYRYPAVDGLEKNDDTRMYCSQLPWVAYKRVADIDIQGGDKGPIIHPDDLYKSDKVDKDKVR